MDDINYLWKIASLKCPGLKASCVGTLKSPMLFFQYAIIIGKSTYNSHLQHLK